MKNDNPKIKICVVGAGGRVGNELLNLINNDAELEPTLGIGSKASGYLFNFKDFNQIDQLGIDIVVDFSSPDLFNDTLKFCISKKVPLVSGTTGLSKEHFEKLRSAGNLIPILWSPNMSLGIAVLKKALGVFKSVSFFDFQIEEWHHRNKKDRPSGTALYLKDELEKIIEKKCPETMVMRGGGIFGVHKVYAASDEELITFEHTALNRTVFARGALVGARWILNNSKNGVYTMDDVIS